MATSWYYSRAGQKLGPVSSAQLKDLAASNGLGPADLVWKQGMADWVPANRIKGLFVEPAIDRREPALPPTARAIGALTQSSTSGHRPIVTTNGEGHLAFSCGSEQAWAIVEKAMTECGVKIKERSSEKGLIRGKCRYGINFFGITVAATLCCDSGTTKAEISATLADAIDTFGACKKKVRQISERITALATAGQPDVSAPIAGAARDAQEFHSAAPNEKAGRKRKQGMAAYFGYTAFAFAMLTLLGCVVVLVVLARDLTQSATTGSSTDPLVGNWQRIGQGFENFTTEFTDGGRVISRYGVGVSDLEGKYRRLNEDSIEIFVVNGPPVTCNVVVGQDTLVVTFPEGAPWRFERKR